jgi:SAM-dependent methyltransferase
MHLDPVSLWRKAKPFVPTRFHRYVAIPYRVYVRALCWKHSLRVDSLAPDGFPLPPPAMRHRVIGSAEASVFANSIPVVRGIVEAALKRINRRLDEFHSILDFGCGCGRSLRAFRGESIDLSGSEIDAEAIAWCRANLPVARWETNGELPPLVFNDAQFDLIYAISVFTHIDEAHQSQWLAELKRVVRPGGLVLLTVHGAAAYRTLPSDVGAQIERDGFFYFSSFADKGRFPDWYQNAYQTEAHVRRSFGRFFEVMDYAPAANDVQDVVLLRRV